MSTRESWGSNLGFFLAAVGSAVGLGNLWRFAYLASEGGGAAFLILYLVMVLVLGIPLFTAELVIGRHTAQSPIRAIAQIGGARWQWLGVVFTLAGFGILSYYAAIMGWTLRVLVDTLRGAVPEATDQYFGAISTGGDAVGWFGVAMALTVAVVIGGVKGGIERISLILMPLLFVMIAALAIWAATLSGGGPGYAYYLRPEPRELLSLETLARAAGQVFFSLSLGMGAMITYASYLKGEGNLARQAGTVALSDTSVAFVGGLVTFPVIYHFGLQGAVGESTVGALFIAVPRAFHSMGSAGVVVGTVFYVALYIAAITSSISMLEVVVAGCMDGLGWSRRKASLIAGAAIALAGIPSALSTDWLSMMDALVGNTLLIFGGLMTALLVGWAWSRGADAELARGLPYATLRGGWLLLLRFVIPVLLVVVLYGALTALVPALRAVFGGGG
jgi:NSS family neurotransmitter:Na+ symporter